MRADNADNKVNFYEQFLTHFGSRNDLREKSSLGDSLESDNILKINLASRTNFMERHKTSSCDIRMAITHRKTKRSAHEFSNKAFKHFY